MMQLVNRILGALVSAMLAMTACTSSMAADAGDTKALEAFVDGVVPTLMKNSNSPSGTLAIVQGGRLVFAKGYGYQDIDRQIPVDPRRTLFRPGSVSKLFTWVAVMQLVEQGKLSLDEDVNTYLQGFKIRDTFAQPITLRHIMTHTTGFEDGSLGFFILEDPARVIPLRDAMERYQPRRVNPPGVQTAYSNYATALAGHIVATVSGLPFNEYVARNIFDVLQMQRSTFAEPLPPHLAEDMAVGYMAAQGRYQKGFFEILSRFGPAGSLSSTSTDMMKFALAIMRGGEFEGRRILRAATVQQMLTRAFSHDERLMGMALGFYERELNGHRLLGHAGAMLFFHSDFVIDPQHDLAIFTSFGAAGGAVVNATFLRAFYDHFYPAAPQPEPTAIADSAARAEAFAGTYLPWRASFSKFEKARRLIGDGLRVTTTPDHALILTNESGSKRYVEIDRNLFREVDPNFTLGVLGSPRQIAFQESVDGEITGLVLDGRPFASNYKASFYQTGGFSRTLVKVTMLIFVMVAAAAFLRRDRYPNATMADKRARRMELFSAGVNIAVLAFGVVVMSRIGANPFGQLPWTFRVFVWLPLLVVIAALLMLLQTMLVWRHGLLASPWERARYSVITICSVAMCWFYMYWNLIGPQYFD